MPIYEYRCRACSREFERYVSGAVSPAACPQCSSSDVVRKLSVFAFKAEGGVASAMPSGGGCCGGSCSCH